MNHSSPTHGIEGTAIRVAVRIFVGFGVWDPGIDHRGVDVPGLPYLGMGVGYPF
jgi:hypothetical protein